MQRNSFMLAALLLVCVSMSAQAQSEADRYAQNLNTSLGYNYAMKFIEMVRVGWPPVRAYHAMFAYKNGWQIGYFRGWHEGAYQSNRPLIESWAANFNSSYTAWLQWHQSQTWSQDVWGSFEKGYHDGYSKGRAAGWNQGVSIQYTQVPGPDPADFGRARSIARGQLDPNDPYADLRNRPMITGPGSF